MKFRSFFASLTASAIILSGCANASTETSNKLVILHTNDTHSQLEPGADGLGGVMRRKAIIDSVRGAEKNVLLVDAGDAVQGTLYFYLYGGRVEQEMMNRLGVDARILGNHEFDNGMDSLAMMMSLAKSDLISTNYKLENSALAGMFKPYIIKEYSGKRIGIMGINLDPVGMITKGNYDGLEFLPIIDAANETARKLRDEEKVDAVIALSHIGYNPKGLIGDSILATNSCGIDIIIGGHSHDTIDPETEEGARRSHLKNLDGQEVLVVQTGKSGRRIGKIEIDLDSLRLGAKPKYELIKVDNRYDNYNDSTLAAALAPYTAGVDSLMKEWIGSAPHDLEAGGTEMTNYFSDFILDAGKDLAPGVDFAIANKGGLRTDIRKGKFSKGQIINLVPFKNYVTVVDVKGSDLLDVFNVMAATDGNGISANVHAWYSHKGEMPRATRVVVNGKEIDPDKTYRVATIDYLAKGGDYMSGLTRGNIVAQGTEPVYSVFLYYLTTGKGARKPFGGDTQARWTSID